MNKRISVVTVCFNAEETIRSTIESVLNQDYDNIEYLIVDGESKDSTMQIVGEYILDNRVRVICEPDDGLYDAMNKATRMATGDYMIFMNSGDIFCDASVVSDMSCQLDSDVVYGNVIRIKTDGEHRERYCRKSIKWLLLKGLMICHQSMFINTKTMSEYGYNLNYKITADFNFLCLLVRNKASFRYVDRDVAKMDNIVGISMDKKNLPIMWEEDDRSIKECFPVWYQVLRPVKFIKRKFF